LLLELTTFGAGVCHSRSGSSKRLRGPQPQPQPGVAAGPPTPTPATAAVNTNNATNKNARNKMTHFLKDDLRAGMELLKDTHRNAHDALREASQVDEPSYRQKKAKRAGKGAGISTASGGEGSVGG